MLLAFISVLPPAIARATLLFTGDQAAQMWAVNLVVLIFVAVDLIRHRRLHPAFGWGEQFVELRCGGSSCIQSKRRNTIRKIARR
jgi:hypothetical protein